MNPEQIRLVDYLKHLREAIERIQRYVENCSEAQFLSSALLQDAVIRNLEIVGEASRNIEQRFPSFVAEHPDLPLVAAYEMRNVLAHGYFKVDLDIVWRTIQSDLPALHARVNSILLQLARI